MALLEIDRLSYRVPARPVLDAVDMTLAAGEIHALVGTNGTGKSTLAYLIMGCEGYRPDSGEIRFAGRRIDSLPLHERARLGITEGNAADARGHVDYLEIVKGRAVASAQPILKVSHPQAKVAHEAAIGSVDHHQVETLMAHGLSPEQAVDLIVGGLPGQGDSVGIVRFRQGG
jgi:Fe-S cluster assembly ATPase SufC